MKKPTVKSELAKAVRDFWWWVRAIRIYDVDRQKIVPFKAHPEQKDLISRFRPGNRIVVLKGRRVGITTICMLYELWLVWREVYGKRRPSKVIVCTATAAKASERIRDIAQLNDRLPEAIQIPWITDSATCLVTDCGAGIWAMGTGGTAAESGARGEGAVFVHLTEFDYYADQEATLSANSAVMSKTGNMVIETTVRAPGTLYHEMVTKAASAEGAAYDLAWYPWWKHPTYIDSAHPIYDYDVEEIAVARQVNVPEEELPARMAWWRKKREELPDRDAMGREYPTTISDAFRISDGTFLPANLFDHVMSIPVTGQETVFPHFLRAGRPLVMGVDVGKGTGGDYSAIHILDAGTLDPVYLWYSNRASTRDLSIRIGDLHVRYGSPLTIIEANSIGLAVWEKVLELGLSNLWRDPETQREWNTGHTNKMLAYERLRSLLQSRTITAIPQPTMLQLQSLIIPPGGASPAAPKGAYDDLAMSYILTVWAAKYVSASQIMRSDADDVLDRMRANSLRHRATPWG